uniref:GPI alpha-1,4-mannosyltransferase I, catalytic subunit n=1 Tax=Timema bartmani TaxID=61472 RepID=A0A7R9I9L3_9NEOP|nr:unnamed protein product [Timema bartmani]
MVDIVRHCVYGVLVRLVVIIYGTFHDKMSAVQYTDVDYRVFTDAARHILEGNSPYDRHTYRYTPLLAYVLVPNILLHTVWGKVFFSLVDVLVALLTLSLVNDSTLSVKCALAWLYNPLAIVIATRGNADSISAALVLATLVLLQKNKVVLAGVVHALAIHVRLYPLAFSLPMYLSLQTSSKAKKKTSFLSSLIPNRDQICLVSSCVGFLAFVTGVFYWLYGYEFLYESLLYHLGRRDIRHNFSVYFYMLYLNSHTPDSILQKVVMFAPQALLLLALSFVYGSKRHLLFCVLTQAYVMVTYNPVMTSQYFIWFISLIPPSFPNINLSTSRWVALGALWGSAQLAWLLPAYWLEFRGRDTFIFVWLQGVAFFSANVAVLAQLIRAYKYHERENKKIE